MIETIYFYVSLGILAIAVFAVTTILAEDKSKKKWKPAKQMVKIKASRHGASQMELCIQVNCKYEEALIAKHAIIKCLNEDIPDPEGSEENDN